MDVRTKRRLRKLKKFSSFDRELRVGKYRSNRRNENIIDALNSSLSVMDALIREAISGKSQPSIIITGVPRSGTTLINQLLPARYDFGYVSNLMARFYRVPLAGAWLQQQLMSKDIHSLRKFSSNHGVTNQVYEPHEFGYFWASYLDFDSDCHEPINQDELDRIDFQSLCEILSELSKSFNRTMVFKCSVAPFMVNSFMRHTDTFFVHMTRDKRSTLESILQVRESRLGDRRNWWSVRPHGWRQVLDNDPIEQVEWQYDRIVRAIRDGSIGFESRVCEVSLEELVQSPEAVLQYVVERYSNYAQVPVAKVGEPIHQLGS